MDSKKHREFLKTIARKLDVDFRSKDSTVSIEKRIGSYLHQLKKSSKINFGFVCIIPFKNKEGFLTEHEHDFIKELYGVYLCNVFYVR